MSIKYIKKTSTLNLRILGNNFHDINPRLKPTLSYSNYGQEKTGAGIPSNFNSIFIGTDGDSIYYSNPTSTYGATGNYVLNKSTSTGINKTGGGFSELYGDQIGTDGENIYYSSASAQKVLNKATSTGSNKTWSGLTTFSSEYVGSDGNNIYYSNGSTQKVLDKSTSTGSNKTGMGLSQINGSYIGTDGTNIYYSSNGTNKILNKSNSSGYDMGTSLLLNGDSAGTDGNFVYISGYVFDKSTFTFTNKTGSGLSNNVEVYGDYVGTDGENIYYCNTSTTTKKHYVLYKQKVNSSTIKGTNLSLGTTATTAAAGNHTHSNHLNKGELDMSQNKFIPGF